MTVEQMQLKVCEGCGGLWVRPSVHGGVYCTRCESMLKAFPKVSELRTGRPSTMGLKQRRRRKKRQSGVTLRKLHAVAVAGGAR